MQQANNPIVYHRERKCTLWVGSQVGSKLKLIKNFQVKLKLKKKLCGQLEKPNIYLQLCIHRKKDKSK